MNQNFIGEFVKRAQAAGLTKEQAEKFVQEQIMNTKQAEAQELDKFISHILNESHVEKTAQSFAYVEGVLKAAVDSGCNVQQAAEVSKIALAKLQQGYQKKAASQPTPELTAYAQGFLKAAAEAGLTQSQSVNFLKVAVQKQSNDPALMEQLQALLSGGGEGGGMGGDMMGGGMPSPEMGGMGGGMGQDLGGASPSILQALLSSLGGGSQGGAPGGMPGGMPGGAGAGGQGGLFKQLPQ